MNPNPVRHKIKRGELSLGTWSVSGNPFIIEAMARSRFEWVTIDMEHGAIDITQCLPCINTIEAAGKVPFVRVPWNETIQIRRVLDIGALGVVVPNVDSAADAERAVRAARYAPLGVRGIGSSRGQLVHGEDYYSRANDEICVVLMIESVAAVEDIDNIMQVPGVDCCFIGPNDLASSMGVPLGLNNPHPEHRAMVGRVIEAGRRHGVPVGIHCADADELVGRIDQGCTWLAVGSDLRFLKMAMGDTFRTLDAGREARRKQGHDKPATTLY